MFRARVRVPPSAKYELLGFDWLFKITKIQNRNFKTNAYGLGQPKCSEHHCWIVFDTFKLLDLEWYTQVSGETCLRRLCLHV